VPARRTTPGRPTRIYELLGELRSEPLPHALYELLELLVYEAVPAPREEGERSFPSREPDTPTKPHGAYGAFRAASRKLPRLKP
jgi:hypothetical protein